LLLPGVALGFFPVGFFLLPTHYERFLSVLVTHGASGGFMSIL
jgi:hypothetical protein